MEKIIIIGGGGHAKVVIAILKKLSVFSILGYLDVNDRGAILGVAYLGTDDQLPIIKKKYPECAAAIGVGNVDVSFNRQKIKEKLVKEGFKLPALVAASAVIQEDVLLKPGAVVMDGVVIHSGSRIGACAIINTKSSIDHDCHVGDFVHVGPGSTICGGVKIERNTLVGAGTVIIQNKAIAEQCLIGAGSTVIGDLLETGKYAGTPARRIK